MGRPAARFAPASGRGGSAGSVGFFRAKICARDVLATFFPTRPANSYLACRLLIQGAASGPQGEQTPPRIPKQPPQTSNRRSAKHEHQPQERKNFSPEEDPSMQGLPHTKPDVINREHGLQGLAGRSQASGAKSDDVSETSARRGTGLRACARRSREDAGAQEKLIARFTID
jgi:hypothetical protein